MSCISAEAEITDLDAELRRVVHDHKRHHRDTFFVLVWPGT